MDSHFKNGKDLEQIQIAVEGLPEGMTFDDLEINQQRLIAAAVQQQQILQLQGDKIALLCMRKISLYDTYEQALAVKNSCPFIDSTIFFPKGYKKDFPTSSNDLTLHTTVTKKDTNELLEEVTTIVEEI